MPLPSSAAVRRAETKATAFFCPVTLQTPGLPRHADAVDAPIGIATGIMAHCSARVRLIYINLLHGESRNLASGA
jgi:hypothetical protein